MHPVSCTNTHHDVIINFVNHGMFKNTKTWISWEWFITFLWNKKNLNLCLRWHISRNYHFVAEVNFMNWMQKTLDTVIGEKQKLLTLHEGGRYHIETSPLICSMVKLLVYLLYPLVSIPHFIAIDSLLYLNISKIG